MTAERLARFWSWTAAYRGAYARGLAWLVLTNVFALAIPWVLRDAVHALERGVPPGTIARYACAIIALALIQAWVRTLSRLVILGASRRIAFDVREAFFSKLLTLDAAFYDGQRTGDLMSRGVNDLQLLQAFYGPGLLNALNTAIVYVGVLVAMVRIDAGLAAAACALFPLLYLGVNRLSRRVYAKSLAVQEQLASISNRAQENISGIQQVKIYAQEAREIEGFRALCDAFRAKSLGFARVRGVMVALIGTFTGFGTLVVLFLGGLHVIEGRITLGDFVAFNAYFAQLAWPTIALGWIVNVFQRAAGAMDRVDEILRAEPSVPVPGGAVAPPLDGSIRLSELSFAYASAPGVDVLSGISLTIPAGSKVAIVGSVGAGKSTLAHLIARIYPVPRGTMFFGDEDATEIPVERVRAGVALVPQEAFLFSRTLADNVRLARPSADAAEVEGAVAVSRLDADLPALPAGLATVVGERGYTLSGGQRQRATLARALLADAPILVLDDALSAVDAGTEREILDGLERERRGRTLILVTHRYAALKTMDRIVVLERGRLVEEGAHDDLIARNGAYARLYRRRRLEERVSQ